MSSERMYVVLVTSWDYPHVGGVSSHMATLDRALRLRGRTVLDMGVNSLRSAHRGPTYIAALPYRQQTTAVSCRSWAAKRCPMPRTFTTPWLPLPWPTAPWPSLPC